MSLSRSSRRPRDPADIWPGFVDALSSLLLVIIFLLSMFVLAQFFLSQALSGRDAALTKLRGEIAELGELLALERAANEDLRTNITHLTASLQTVTLSRDDLEAEVRSLEARIDAAEGRTGTAGEDVDELVRDLRERYGDAQSELSRERALTRAAREEVDLLNRQLAALRQQLASLQNALEASEARDEEQQATIVSLGNRLNAALAGRVEELARYRSEFFGRLREVLSSRSDIRIQGDRFIFQSEIFFASGSANVGSSGQAELSKLADALLEVAENIPEDIPWILLVEGHTDPLPIRGGPYPSNWELSAARALSVVHYLQGRGVPPERLGAAGFGPFQPIDPGSGMEANQRNRRIELKFTQQ
ncbi:MAG: peptidoglycan -binding protein [Sphingomonadales bacterium]